MLQVGLMGTNVQHDWGCIHPQHAKQRPQVLGHLSPLVLLRLSPSNAAQDPEMALYCGITDFDKRVEEVSAVG